MAIEQSLSNAKQLLKTLAQKIPPALHDVDKQVFIGTGIMPNLSIEEKTLLKYLMDAILMKMRKSDASDIELGGDGSKNKIWLRIHGRKTPVEEFGTYLADEFNILIQSVLMDKQREVLIEERSIDFSHTVNIGINGDIKKTRYRANAYFELGELALNMRAIGDKIRPYQSYGFSSNVTKMVSLMQTKEGLILVTGITGSGKSTTLDAIVALNNRSIVG